jgi:hypothetical protein
MSRSLIGTLQEQVLTSSRLSKSQLQAPEKYKSMLHSFMRHLCIVVLGFLAVSFAFLASAQANQNSLREVAANVKDTRGPVDHFFDLLVGSDYCGTLIRDDSQAQLKLVTGELGFRYIRFHAVFHDVLGTVRVENGKTVYDWANQTRAAAGSPRTISLKDQTAAGDAAASKRRTVAKEPGFPTEGRGESPRIG